MQDNRTGFKIVTFYTPGPYRIECDKLEQSLADLGAEPPDVMRCGDRGSWDLNHKWKPMVILRALNIYNRPVLFLDADATVHKPIELEIRGDARGQALLPIPWDSALKLVDLMMETPPGTTSDVRFAERTMLAEVGNLVLAHFLNAVVALCPASRHLQPSSPNVMVDTLERILSLGLMVSIVRGIDPLAIETILANTGKTVHIHFLVLPDYTVSRERVETSATGALGAQVLRRV